MKWIRVTHVENIPVRQGRAVQIGGREVAIFNLGADFRAVENRCPHRNGPLADGIVAGEDVICPLHNWRLSLVDGAVRQPKDSHGCVQTFPVCVEDGVILVALPAEEGEAAA